MIHLSTLLKFPMNLKDRKSSLFFLKTEMINQEINNSNMLLTFKTKNISNNNSYNQMINVLELPKNINSKVQIYCDCDSFKYEFSKGLYLIQSLYNIDLFDVKSKAKSKNIICGCKHIINCAIYIHKHMDIFKGI